MGLRLRAAPRGGGGGCPSLSTCVLLTFILVATIVLARAPPKVAQKATKPRAKASVIVPPQEDDGEPMTTFQRRIIAVGDLHGDMSHFTRILRHCGLIDLRGSWIGGDATLVQTGDIVDRGKDTIAIYRFMDLLRPQATKAGGRVISLLGNHEIMNAMGSGCPASAGPPELTIPWSGDWRYVSPDDIATFGGERQRRFAMTEGWIGQTWRANYSITARVEYPPRPAGASSTPARGVDQLLLATHTQADVSDERKGPFRSSAVSFVHGGITPGYIESLSLHGNASLGNVDAVTRINEIGAGLMESLASAGSPLQLPRNATREQREFWSAQGPMWDRSYALEEEETMCAKAERACELLGVQHLVMGHTPTFEHIVSRCDGRVLLIDTGISRAYGGVLSALQIEYNLVSEPAELDIDDGVAADVAGTGNWIETEIITALYVGGEDVEIGRWERIVDVE